MEIRQVCTHGNEIISDITAEYDKNDYEIMGRVWARSDCEPIREWTVEEYVKCDPRTVKIMPVKIGDVTIEVEAHCQELRRVFARNKNKVKICSFTRVFDYQEK